MTQDDGYLVDYNEPAWKLAINRLAEECRKRGQEIERQAAEILELRLRIETQAETIRLREELEMYK
jgi:hypothetical protein